MKSQTKPKSRIVIKKGFVTQLNGASITIFDAEKSTLHTFNATATFMFDRLKKGVDLTKIITDITKEFKITEENASKDLMEFIEDLKKKGVAKEI